MVIGSTKYGSIGYEYIDYHLDHHRCSVRCMGVEDKVNLCAIVRVLCKHNPVCYEEVVLFRDDFPLGSRYSRRSVLLILLRSLRDCGRLRCVWMDGVANDEKLR